MRTVESMISPKVLGTWATRAVNHIALYVTRETRRVVHDRVGYVYSIVRLRQSGGL